MEKMSGARTGAGEEEELVVTNPKLAGLIYHSANVAFLLVLILFIVHVVVYYNASEVWWHALLGASLVSPLFIAPLYFTPILRDLFVKEYAMGHPNKYASYVGCKLSEKF